MGVGFRNLGTSVSVRLDLYALVKVENMGVIKRRFEQGKQRTARSGTWVIGGTRGEEKVRGSRGRIGRGVAGEGYRGVGE